jgi:histidyl-tRNA synthetase
MQHKLQPVRGTKDILAADYLKHQHIVNCAHNLGTLYGYQQCATPIFEFSNVFKRSLGDYSDVVTKEMYTFTDKGGEEITLRPEFTAGIMRAVISGGLTHELPLKLFSTGPLFRYERPQKGRMRQFHQINFEYIGVCEPYADSETIALAANILRQLGLEDRVTLHINSLGDKESRIEYQKALVDYFNKHKDHLSEESKVRLQHNPLRILDSKDEGDKQIVAHAPTIEGAYNQESADFFNKVLLGLDNLGIKYKIDRMLVRGLDYYCHTAFEFTTTELGAQSTVLGGGRYDGLMEMMGGMRTPAVGFAAGIERLVEMIHHNPDMPRATAIIAIEEEQIIPAMQLAQKLRGNGEIVEMIYGTGNISKKTKKAHKLKCAKVIFLGPDEINNAQAKIRDLDTGIESLIAL